MPLEPGLSATVDLVVGEADTAPALRSGDVPVLATPRLLALAEEATVAAVSGALDPGSTTVGQQVTLTHRAPTPVGEKVRAEAVLIQADGKRLVFRVTVTGGDDQIGEATVTRVIVDRERFLERIRG